MGSEETETAIIGDFCHACQDDNLEIIQKHDDEISDGDDHDHHPSFFIKFKVEFHYPPALPLEDEDDFLLVRFDLASSVSFHHFWARCKKGLDQEDQESLSWGEISSMLTEIKIPLHKQPLMLHRISACAEEIANAGDNKGLKVFPMMVSISIVADYFCYDLQDSSTLMIREVPEAAKLMMARPASELEIEALAKEIVIVRDGRNVGLVTKCMICLEEAEIGSEIMGMPCSHYYHRDCLLRWLKISNFCPICLLSLAV